MPHPLHAAQRLCAGDRAILRQQAGCARLSAGASSARLTAMLRTQPAKEPARCMAPSVRSNLQGTPPAPALRPRLDAATSGAAGCTPAAPARRRCCAGPRHRPSARRAIPWDLDIEKSGHACTLQMQAAGKRVAEILAPPLLPRRPGQPGASRRPIAAAKARRERPAAWAKNKDGSASSIPARRGTIGRADQIDARVERPARRAAPRAPARPGPAHRPRGARRDDLGRKQRPRRRAPPSQPAALANRMTVLALE